MKKPTLAIYGIKDRNQFGQPGFTHDHNLCLMQDGKIIEYVHLERYSKRKYDNRLDIYIEEILENYFSNLNEFDLISVNSFVGNSFLSKNGRLRVESGFRKELIQTPEKNYGYWQNKIWDGIEIDTWILSQEMSHIGACLPFYGDFQDNSLLIHFDGGASVSNFSAYHYKDHQIKKIEAHWELGFLSKFFNDNSLSFGMLGAQPGEHCSVPGKLMGFSCIGSFCPEIEEWMIEHGYFKDYWHKEKEIFDSIRERFQIDVHGFDTRSSFFQDVAATFQGIFERELMRKIHLIQDRVQADYLYYSGGCALNIIANTKIVETNLFRDVFIPPCPSDSGLSLGAASFLERQKGNVIQIHSPYLNSIGLQKNQDHKITNELIHRVSELLMQGKVIGICNGFGEAGPRALGNRSIIALPNSKSLSQKVSEAIKQREWYRPIAPIMLKKNAELVTGKRMHHLGRFMLLDWKILPEYCAQLEGVIHKNGTARIQYLEKEEDNVFLYRVLAYLDQQRILGLINTSFNGKGEPIVHTQEDAKKSAQKMRLDAVVINHQLVLL